jgi:hypothetical protein
MWCVRWAVGVFQHIRAAATCELRLRSIEQRDAACVSWLGVPALAQHYSVLQHSKYATVGGAACTASVVITDSSELLTRAQTHCLQHTRAFRTPVRLGTLYDWITTTFAIPKALTTRQQSAFRSSIHFRLARMTHTHTHTHTLYLSSLVVQWLIPKHSLGLDCWCWRVHKSTARFGATRP